MRTNVTIGSFVPGNETSTVYIPCMETKRPGTILSTHTSE